MASEQVVRSGINRIDIPGPAGKLEARICMPQNPCNQVAVIGHPHPLYGGTMDNKVVGALDRACRLLSMTTVIFNFRGVGHSEGHFAGGIGETEDFLSVLRFAKQQFPNTTMTLAGFSFGSYVAYRASLKWAASALILVAPPVNHFDFTALDTPTIPWLVVQALKDEVVPTSAIDSWLQSTSGESRSVAQVQASHFFHGQLHALQQTVTQFLQAQLHLNTHA